ncbi:MAG: hypothetical protein L0Y66_27545 [Myxococcaceae bacterium]|nr:hypothetical protein [Myxococcaceae bacterium]MCI0672249.1 hypothetical protein [Myxococcaceae bacterium]
MRTHTLLRAAALVCLFQAGHLLGGALDAAHALAGLLVAFLAVGCVVLGIALWRRASEWAGVHQRVLRSARRLEVVRGGNGGAP